jgi:ABC-type molybdate transport system substrate-binding protein
LIEHPAGELRAVAATWRAEMKRVFFAVLAACFATSSSADEIIFLSANALESSVRELIPQFEKSSGHTVKVSFGNVGNNAERIRKGDPIDLAITSPKLRADLQAEGKIAPEPNTVVAKVGFGVFVKKGAQKPDISSVDGFKHAVVAAKSIAVGDPEKRSPVGTHCHRCSHQSFMDSGLLAELQITSSPLKRYTPYFCCK